MNVKNLIGLEAQEKKFSKPSMIFLKCQKSWNFLHRMISGCYGSSTLEKLGKLRINFHAFQATLRVCLHGGRVPQIGEVARLGGVTRLSIESLILM